MGHLASSRCMASLSVILVHPRFQIAFGHSLQAGIFMRLGPYQFLGIKLEIAALDWPMISFDDAADANQARRIVLFAASRLWRGRYSKAHRIPLALWQRPRAARRVTKVAERLKHVLRRNLVLMLRRGAVSAPSPA